MELWQRFFSNRLLDTYVVFAGIPSGIQTCAYLLVVQIIRTMDCRCSIHQTNFSALQLLLRLVVSIAFCFIFILSLFFILMLYAGLGSPSSASVRTLGSCISCNISLRSIQTISSSQSPTQDNQREAYQVSTNTAFLLVRKKNETHEALVHIRVVLFRNDLTVLICDAISLCVFT